MYVSNIQSSNEHQKNMRNTIKVLKYVPLPLLYFYKGKFLRNRTQVINPGVVSSNLTKT